jgi:hypothetical protein
MGTAMVTTSTPPETVSELGPRCPAAGMRRPFDRQASGRSAANRIRSGGHRSRRSPRAAVPVMPNRRETGKCEFWFG